MTKTELYTKVSEELSKVLDNTKVAKKTKEEIKAIIDEYLKPKTGGGHSINPPIEIEGKMYYFCRWHQCYEPIEDMVISKGKSKGYCKAAISKWNKANSKIKKLDAAAVEALQNKDLEKAQVLADEASKLRNEFNLPSFYNYVEDWATFKKLDNEEDIKELEEKYSQLKTIRP